MWMLPLNLHVNQKSDDDDDDDDDDDGYTWKIFHHFFYKGDKFCDFPFASLNIKPFSKDVYSVAANSSLFRNSSFRLTPFQKAETILTVVSLESVSISLSFACDGNVRLHCIVRKQP